MIILRNHCRKIWHFQRPHAPFAVHHGINGSAKSLVHLEHVGLEEAPCGEKASLRLVNDRESLRLSALIGCRPGKPRHTGIFLRSFADAPAVAAVPGPSADPVQLDVRINNQHLHQDIIHNIFRQLISCQLMITRAE